MKLTSMALTFVALVTVSACKKTIDPDSVETTIEKMLADKGITATATCPKGLEPKKGLIFNCTAVEGTNAPMDFKVELQDDDGKFYVNLIGSLVEATKVEANVKELDPNAVVKCPWKARAMKKDESVTCELSGVEGMKQLKITMTDVDKGTVKYDPLP